MQRIAHRCTKNEVEVADTSSIPGGVEPLAQPGHDVQSQTSQTHGQAQEVDAIEAASTMLLSSLDAEMTIEGEEDSKQASPVLAIVLVLGGLGLLLGGGYMLRGQIQSFLDFFIEAIDEWGTWGYLAYAVCYTTLEVLAIPAIPLTMTAGAIFGPTVGTIIVCLSGTLAATISFLISRYLARDKILKWAQKNKRFIAIDKAIGQDSFKFVTLLRLSPLLPLSASNYLYGLTSVKLGPYIAGSFIGMLPGTWAYVGTGHVGKAVLLEGTGSLNMDLWQVGIGIGATLLALGFVGQLAKKAIEDIDAES